MAESAPKKGSKYNFSEALNDSIRTNKETRTSESIIKNQQTNDVPTSVSGYSIVEKESRTKKMLIMIRPSIGEILDELAKNGTIKSKNDLINYLIEDFIDKNVERKE